MKKIFLTIFSIVLVFSLAACFQKSSTKEEKVLKLGVAPSSNSEKLVDDLEPFAKALGEKLGVKVEVFTASKMCIRDRLNTKEAEEALKYLIDRGLSIDVIKHFNLGYAPREDVYKRQVKIQVQFYQQ